MDALLSPFTRHSFLFLRARRAEFDFLFFRLRGKYPAKPGVGGETKKDSPRRHGDHGGLPARVARNCSSPCLRGESFSTNIETFFSTASTSRCEKTQHGRISRIFPDISPVTVLFRVLLSLLLLSCYDPCYFPCYPDPPPTKLGEGNREAVEGAASRSAAKTLSATSKFFSRTARFLLMKK